MTSETPESTQSPSYITEGLARIEGTANNAVFYNPPQVFNRDLSILVAHTFALEKKKKHLAHPTLSQQPFPGIKILEPLSATGLRGIRYLLEIPNLIQSVHCNDIDPKAVLAIERNRVLNNISHQKLTYTENNAITLLHAHHRQYDLIDLDPYGSIMPFLDAAIYNVRNDGLIAITSTDMQVLGGNYNEVCFGKYGGFTTKRGGTNLHEISLRLLMNVISTTAARYGRSVRFELSLSVDFYVRIFFSVSDANPSLNKLIPSLTGLFFTCPSCPTHLVQPFGALREKAGEKQTEGEEKQAEGEEKEGEEREERMGEKRRRESFAESHGVSEGVLKHSLEQMHRMAKTGKCQYKIHPLVHSKQCPECSADLQIGGPLSLSPPYNPDFLQKVLHQLSLSPLPTSPPLSSPSPSPSLPEDILETPLKTHKRILGILTAMGEELIDVPLHYSLPYLFKCLKLKMIPLRVFKTILLGLGYRVSHFHREPQSVKTDAPNWVLFDILRWWSREEGNGVVEDKKVRRERERGEKEGGEREGEKWGEKEREKVRERRERKGEIEDILNKECVVQREDINFEFIQPEMLKRQIPRFMPNPEPNWGPKARAGAKKDKTQEEL